MSMHNFTHPLSLSCLCAQADCTGHRFYTDPLSFRARVRVVIVLLDLLTHDLLISLVLRSTSVESLSAVF